VSDTDIQRVEDKLNSRPERYSATELLVRFSSTPKISPLHFAVEWAVGLLKEIASHARRSAQRKPLVLLGKCSTSKGALGMYANILLSTDGSDVAKKGVKHGIALAKALNAKVTVITVTDPLPVADRMLERAKEVTRSYGSGLSSGWTPSQEEVDALTQPTRKVRGKCSMKLEVWRSRSGYLQKCCIFRTRTQPLRLSKQSPEAAT
jgi:hypothetical protein